MSGGGNKQGAHFLLTGFHTERHGQVALPHSRRSQEQDVIATLDVAAGGQLADQPEVDGGNFKLTLSAQASGATRPRMLLLPQLLF